MNERAPIIGGRILTVDSRSTRRKPWPGAALLTVNRTWAGLRILIDLSFSSSVTY